jgi:hypothetical protein
MNLNWKTEFGKGFWTGAGVLGAIVVVGIVTGVIGKKL